MPTGVEIDVSSTEIEQPCSFVKQVTAIATAFSYSHFFANALERSVKCLS
jgi:hypothetical protein